MQFLRTAFWVVLAVAIALFCKANNRPTEIKIWGDIVWGTRIWFPILIAFLVGAVPFWIMARTTRWRMKRKLESTERALIAATASAAPAAVPMTATDDISTPPPPLSATGTA
jgi:lipopolysaccharide assembly protein A